MDKKSRDTTTPNTLFHCDFGYYGERGRAVLPQKNIISVLDTQEHAGIQFDEEELVRKAMQNPIDSARLIDLVETGQQVLILVDDYTRQTPAHIILPIVLEELLSAGVEKEAISLLIASGTHRPMTDAEKRAKCGDAVYDTYPILDHRWDDPAAIVTTGVTLQKTTIQINKLLLDADMVIGIGQIVPHRVAGFSGGAKIIQPGVCGAITTGQTHWLSAKEYTGKEILGVLDNPVRREINAVGKQAGLQFIINTVQGRDGSIYECFAGDPVTAHAVGCKTAMDVFGAKFDALADMVIVDTYPALANMWQASKGIYSADLALKPDGVLIVMTECNEGISSEHPEVEKYGYSSPDAIEQLVEEGGCKDLTVAAHILHVGRVISGERTAILVSTGIDTKTAEHVGFIPVPTLQAAIDLGFSLKGDDATVVVMHHGGEVMPVLR